MCGGLKKRYILTALVCFGAVMSGGGFAQAESGDEISARDDGSRRRNEQQNGGERRIVGWHLQAGQGEIHGDCHRNTQGNAAKGKATESSGFGITIGGHDLLRGFYGADKSQ